MSKKFLEVIAFSGMGFVLVISPAIADSSPSILDCQKQLYEAIQNCLQKPLNEVENCTNEALYQYQACTKKGNPTK